MPRHLGCIGATVALADVKTFVAGATLKAADLNANFAEPDARASELEATSLSAVDLAELNTTDDPAVVDWQGYATTRISNGFTSGHFSSLLAARRKCIGLGYKSGWYTGEFGSTGDGNTRTIYCIQ